MSKFSRKLISGALAVTTSAWMSGAVLFVPVVHAQSVAELQAQIAALLAQIQALQAQLNAAQGGGAASFNFTRDLTVGSTGDDVKALQQFLNSRGFQVAASGPGSPGNETTYFGSLTKAALAKYQASVGIMPSAGYFGPKTRAYINSLAVGGGSGGGSGQGGGNPPPPAEGLAISLASDNPAGGTLPKGATGVVFLKFNVSGSGTLSSLTFKREGIGTTGDFAASGVYLYEGNNRLTSGKTLNSTTHEVSFASLNLSVSGTRTLSLVADVDQNATAGNSNKFSLVSAAGTPTPSGTVSGNEFRIAGQSVGTITADDQTAPANPKIGQKKAPLLEFQLSAGSTEDVLIHRLSLTEGGTISNSALSNFVLEQAGNVVATANAIGEKDLVVLNFTSPFKLEKGQNRNFILYADIAGNARQDDTIVFYFDSKSDIYAVGATYGYPVMPTISNIDTASESDTLTVAGGDITITFNGPIAGNIALRGNDVTVFDFTIASANNVEIRNLRLHASTTGLASGEGFNDFKLWDVDANAVISSATDITTSTSVTVTDVINISAGVAKRMKVTVDVDADNDDGDDIQVQLLPFQANDIRNLDNNTYVSVSTIVPSSALVGNVQDTSSPALNVQLAGMPTSQSVVRGSQNVSLVGFSLRATSDDIKITSIKISASLNTATGSVSTINSDLVNVALYDGSTRVSDIKSFSGSALPSTITFSNMNYIVPKGTTKVLTVKANISTAAQVDAGYFVYLAATTDVSAVDSQSNTVTPTGTTANSGATVVATVLNVGDVTVAKATDDSESKSRIVLATGEEVLGKFKFTATNEAMIINKLRISVIDSASVTATSTAAVDEVSVIKLYDGTTQIGAAGGYSLDASGNSAGVATIEGLNWSIGKNEERTLVVKGVMNPIDLNSSNGADAGASLYVNIQSSGFEAAGSSALDTSIAGASGNRMLLYRGKPTVTVQTLPSSSLTTNPVVARVRVAAGATPISFKTLQFKLEPINATVVAGTTSNVSVFDITEAPSTALTLATVVMGASPTSTGSAAITGGSTGYLTIYFSTAEEIAANSYSDYDVKVTLTNISGTVGAAKLTTSLNLYESSPATVGTFSSISGAGDDGNPSFIWSDNSKISHSETTADWTNGYLTELPVSSPWLLSN